MMTNFKIAGSVMLFFTLIGGRHLLAEPPVAAAPKAQTVYEANFATDEAGPQWSAHPSSKTPKGERRFLGPFREAPLQLSLDHLPAHEFVRVRFELLLMEPWNGDSSNWGRDLWDMRVVDGQPLVHTTFGNCLFFEDNNEQSYPDQYPWYPTHPACTGAALTQAFGYTFNWGGPNRTFGVDSTYLMNVVFPHTGGDLKLEFKSQIKHNDKKPYGFLTFKVETIDNAAPATDNLLMQVWDDLASEDAVRANRAVWSLVETGDAATEYIRTHLPDADPTVPLNIEQDATWKHGSFEYAADAVQRARAIHVLEVIHSPAAQSILTNIGYKGTPQGGPPNEADR